MFRRMAVMISIFLVFLCSNLMAAETIKLASLEWEPYIGPKMPDGGYVAEIVNEAFKKNGKTAQIDYLPWARAVKMAKDGDYAGYLPEYYSEDLKKDFILSAPFPGGPLGFFKKKSSKITFKTLEDLKPYSIGVVRGYVNTAEFDAASYLKKDEAKDDLTNLKKLIAGRIELIVCDKYVGEHLLKTELKESAGEVEFIEPGLENKDLYLCISKALPNGQKIMDEFNAAIKQMADDGTMKKIMEKQGIKK